MSNFIRLYSYNFETVFAKNIKKIIKKFKKKKLFQVNALSVN